MFLQLTIENNKRILINSDHVVSVAVSYQLVPDTHRSGAMTRIANGSLVICSDGTRLTVQEDMDDIVGTLGSKQIAPAVTSDSSSAFVPIDPGALTKGTETASRPAKR